VKSSKKTTFGVFDAINVMLMLLLVIVTLFPFWVSLIGSLNEGLDYTRGGVYFFPRKFTLANYRTVFVDKSIFTAFGVTTARTIIGTLTSVFFTLMVSYAMSRSNLRFKSAYMIAFLIPMFFGGGIIPVYLLYRQLNLLDKFVVYIIPGLFSAWNMIIFISFIKSVPESIIESARIDGAGEYTIFFRFIVPLSKPAIAAIALFTGVGHWNSYFDSMMYTTSNNLQTLQLFLTRIITSSNAAAGIGSGAAKFIPQQAIKVTPETIKLAMMIVTTGPIIIIYPFLQKYFIKGVFIGSVKG
jgi:putative aldouronate transport system permease protein